MAASARPHLRLFRLHYESGTCHAPASRPDAATAAWSRCTPTSASHRRQVYEHQTPQARAAGYPSAGRPPRKSKSENLSVRHLPDQEDNGKTACPSPAPPFGPARWVAFRTEDRRTRTVLGASEAPTHHLGSVPIVALGHRGTGGQPRHLAGHEALQLCALCCLIAQSVSASCPLCAQLDDTTRNRMSVTGDARRAENQGICAITTFHVCSSHVAYMAGMGWGVASSEGCERRSRLPLRHK
jgi:hypothetical protein